MDSMVVGHGGRLAVRAKGLDAAHDSTAILVHGANLAGPLAFDFQHPGGYSLMDHLVANGIAAVTFGVRGYGDSEVNGDPLAVDTDQGIEDLATIADWLAAQGERTFHLLGWSWGGRISARYTETNGGRVNRLVLYDTAFGGPARDVAGDAPYQENTAEFFSNRLEPEWTDPDARAAFGRTAVQTDPRSPNGIRAEVRKGAIPVQPAKITRPTLITWGSGAADHEGLKPSEVFDQLATPDKALVLIPNGGHYLQVQRSRTRFFDIVTQWFKASNE